MKRFAGLFTVGLLLILLFVIANMALAWILGGRPADATSRQRYTLSEESEKIAASLQQPISLRLYVSENLSEYDRNLAAYATETTIFLGRYHLTVPEKIKLEIRRVKAFSETEKQAVADGMLPLAGQEKDYYFGLKILSSDGRSTLFPALLPERGPLFETDLKRVLSELNKPEKIKLGVFSSRLPLFSATKSIAPTLAALLHEYYDVTEISGNKEIIEPDIDVLLVLNPVSLPSIFAYALDQYVMHGGKVIFLVDPYSEVQHELQGYPPHPDTQMSDYLKVWGIDYQAERISGDVLNAERVKDGSGRYRVYPLWFFTEQPNGQRLRFHTPGSLAAIENGRLRFSELAATGRQSGEIAAAKVRYASKIQVILDYEQDNKKRVLALLAEGEFRSHYRGSILDNTPSAGKVPPYLPFTVKEAAVAVVADSDFAADDLWVLSRQPENPVYGVVPYAGNAYFLTTLIDRLAGHGLGEMSPTHLSGVTNIAESLYRRNFAKYAQERENLEAAEADSAARLQRLQRRMVDRENPAYRKELQNAELENRADKKALQNLDRKIVTDADHELMLLTVGLFIVCPLLILLLFLAAASLFRFCVRRKMKIWEKNK